MKTDVDNNRIYPGSIVVVINGLSNGNMGNTITKIVFIKDPHNPIPMLRSSMGFIIVEDRSIGHGNSSQLGKTKTGRGMWYERADDVRLATVKEKEMFNRGIYSIK